MAEADASVLCGANSYEEKYYFNERFGNLPKSVQDELHALSVLFTEECGGILVLRFSEEGSLLFETRASDNDYLYDEIETGLQIRKLRKEKEELFSALELYYRLLFLKKNDEA